MKLLFGPLVIQLVSRRGKYPPLSPTLRWISVNYFQFSVTLETASSSKKKRKVKSMFPLSAVADSKSKTVTREECIELAKMIYGRVLNLMWSFLILHIPNSNKRFRVRFVHPAGRFQSSFRSRTGRWRKYLPYRMLWSQSRGISSDWVNWTFRENLH